MNKLLFLIFLLFSINCFSSQHDSLEVSDKYPLSKEIKKNKVADLIITGGFGMSTGSLWDTWKRYHEKGPAFNLGIEMPLTAKNYFSIELMEYLSISKKKDYSYDKKGNEYLRIIDDYDHIVLAGIKYILFTLKKPDILNISMHLNYFFSEDEGFNMGFSANYQFNETLSFYLVNRIMLTFPRLDGNTNEQHSNLLLLQVCYNWKW